MPPTPIKGTEPVGPSEQEDSIAFDRRGFRASVRTVKARENAPRIVEVQSIERSCPQKAWH